MTVANKGVSEAFRRLFHRAAYKASAMQWNACRGLRAAVSVGITFHLRNRLLWLFMNLRKYRNNLGEAFFKGHLSDLVRLRRYFSCVFFLAADGLCIGTTESGILAETLTVFVESLKNRAMMSMGSLVTVRKALRKSYQQMIMFPGVLA